MAGHLRRTATRVISGAAAVAPLVAIGMVAAIALGFRSRTFPLAAAVMVSGFLSLLIYGVAVGYFLYLIQTEKRFDSADKQRWTIIVLFWFPFGAIGFWYQFIWRKQPTVGADRAETQ